MTEKNNKTRTKEKIIYKKNYKLNLYPNKLLEQAIKKYAKQQNRSLNNFCLMILENACITNPSYFGLENIEVIDKEDIED